MRRSTSTFDRAPQTIKNLENARDQMQDLLKEAAALGRVTPPAQDPVSRDAAFVLSDVAIGDRPDSLITVLKAGVEHLNSLINNLNLELQSYQRSEEEARSILRGDATHS